ncbi:hypothetical protein HF086_005604, partial [Spodoptera exigua]
MENFSEICISAFFSAPIEENIEQSNSEFNQELSKVCHEMEKRELFHSSYDQELSKVCDEMEKRELFDSSYDQELSKVCDEMEKRELFDSSYDQELSKVCDEMEKRELFDSSYDDELYNQCVMAETTLIHQQVGRGIKQGIITNENKVTKKAKLDEGASTSSIETNDVDNNKVECDTCHVYIAKSQGDDLNIFYSSLIDTVVGKICEFEKKDSGWSLNQNQYIDMNVNKFNPLRGSSYVNLPQDIKLKKAVINVKNNDNMCFKWALLSGLYPACKSVDRVASYAIHGNKLKFTEERLNSHRQYDCAHICTELPNGEDSKKDWFGKPTSNNKLKFDKFAKKLEMPFVIYANFEAFLNPIESCSNDPSKPSTINIQKHEVYSFGYYIKCSYDNRLSKYETYSGSNCAQVFMNRLCEDVKTIVKKNSFQKCPVPLSDEDEIKISNSNICYICETELNEDLFYDFDWHTGSFRGVAHQVCSSKYRTPRHIPIFLHNLSHYDAHFIVHALNFDDNKVEVIPKNKESLDQLAKNLNDDQFTELKRNYPNNEDFSRLRRK